MQKILKAKKTINDVFQDFFKEQETKLRPSTLKKYEEVLYLFKESLNSYAYLSLDEGENKKFENHFNADGDAHLEFCDIFGPDKILENVDEFTNYFMIRKVCASKELMRSVGTVIKKLGKWLLEKQYIDSEEGREIIEIGSESSVDLPASEELRVMLVDCANSYFGGEVETIQGHFTVVAVQSGKLSLSSLDLMEKGIVIKVPKHVSNACKAGWTISGELGKKGKKFFFTDIWNVYP